MFVQIHRLKLREFLVRSQQRIFGRYNPNPGRTCGPRSSELILSSRSASRTCFERPGRLMLGVRIEGAHRYLYPGRFEDSGA